MVTGTEPPGLSGRTTPGAPAGGDTSRPEGAAALFERLADVEAAIRDDRHRQPADFVETVAALRAAGGTVAGIAALTGVSPHIVRDRLRRAGALEYLFRNRHRHVQDVLERRGAEMIAAYEAGATISALAARAGVSFHTLRTYLVTHGVAVRNHRGRAREILEARGAELAADYESGASIKDLAIRVEVTPSTIRKFLIAGGVPLRHDPGRYPRKRRPDEA